jgi:hypothetical protein
MIKTISNSSPYINVSGNSSYYPYTPTPTTLNPPAAVGSLRLNNGNFEVWDGNNWQIIAHEYVSIGLTSDAAEAITWVREKIALERKIEQLAVDTPAVADALATVKDSLEKLQVILALTLKEVT